MEGPHCFLGLFLAENEHRSDRMQPSAMHLTRWASLVFVVCTAWGESCDFEECAKSSGRRRTTRPVRLSSYIVTCTPRSLHKPVEGFVILDFRRFFRLARLARVKLSHVCLAWGVGSSLTRPQLVWLLFLSKATTT